MSRAPSAGWLAAMAGVLVARRFVILPVLAIVTLIAAVLATRIPFDFTPQAIFEGGDDLVAYAERFKAQFGYEDATLLLVVESTGKPDVLSPEMLNWQGKLAERLTAIDAIERVDSISTIELLRLRVWGPPFVYVAPLIDDFPVDDAGTKKVKDLLSRSKMIEGSLVSKDHRVSMIVLKMRGDARDVATMNGVLKQVEAEVAQSPLPSDYALHYGGIPALRVDIVRALEADQAFLLPAAGLSFFVLLCLIFRRVSISLLALTSVGIGLAWTMGMLVVLGQSLNIISNVLPVLLLVIGVANAVHVISRYTEECKLHNGDRLTAAKNTIQHMMLACLLTFSTTAVGFLSLMAARSSVLQALGWQAALGMVLLYFSTILILGAMLPLFRPPRHITASSAQVSPLSHFTMWLGSWVANHPRVTFAVSLAVLGLAIFQARNVQINSFTVETYEESHPMIRGVRLIDEQLSGFLPLEISLEADRADAFLEPAIYEKVLAAQAFALSQPEILFARSYADFQQEALTKGGRTSAAEAASDPQLGRKLARNEHLFREFAEPLAYHEFISPDSRWSRMLLKVHDIGTLKLLGTIHRLEDKLAELFPPGCGVHFRLTGDAYVSAVAMDRFIYDLFSSLLTASLVIFGIIALMLGSLRLGLIAAIPNIAPLIVTLGYIGWRGYDMNVSNVIVLTISLGIAVDDTIHFLLRFREEIAIDHDPRAAIRRTFAGTGSAIVLMTLLIMVGMSTLLWSEFVPTQRFAELTIVTMAAALVGDLALLPASVILFGRFAAQPCAATPAKAPSHTLPACETRPHVPLGMEPAPCEQTA